MCKTCFRHKRRQISMEIAHCTSCTARVLSFIAYTLMHVHLTQQVAVLRSSAVSNRTLVLWVTVIAAQFELLFQLIVWNFELCRYIISHCWESPEICLNCAGFSNNSVRVTLSKWFFSSIKRVGKTTSLSGHKQVHTIKKRVLEYFEEIEFSGYPPWRQQEFSGSLANQRSGFTLI